MISAQTFFVICESEGAYLSRNRRFWVRPHNPRNPGGYTPTSIGAFGRREALVIVARPPAGEQRPRGAIDLRPAPRCACCGKHDFELAVSEVADGQWRCARHKGRNPCAIEGCPRSRGGKHPSLDSWICAEHWRRYCPPRSMRRRAYHAFFRRAKRYGWTDDLNRQFWRFWFTLIRSARRKSTEGAIDRGSIDRMFGWG